MCIDGGERLLESSRETYSKFPHRKTALKKTCWFVSSFPTPQKKNKKNQTRLYPGNIWRRCGGHAVGDRGNSQPTNERLVRLHDDTDLFKDENVCVLFTKMQQCEQMHNGCERRCHLQVCHQIKTAKCCKLGGGFQFFAIKL